MKLKELRKIKKMCKKNSTCMGCIFRKQSGIAICRCSAVNLYENESDIWPNRWNLPKKKKTVKITIDPEKMRTLWENIPIHEMQPCRINDWKPGLTAQEAVEVMQKIGYFDTKTEEEKNIEELEKLWQYKNVCESYDHCGPCGYFGITGSPLCSRENEYKKEPGIVPHCWDLPPLQEKSKLIQCKNCKMWGPEEQNHGKYKGWKICTFIDCFMAPYCGCLHGKEK